MSPKTRNKVLLMTPALNRGGEELSTINLARELAGRGYEAVYMSSGGPLEDTLKRYGVRFIRAAVDGRGPVGILRGAYEIRKFLSREEVSIIHAQTPWPALMSRLAGSTLLRRPPVIWHDRGIRRGNYRLVSNIANIFFDFVITNSDDEKRLLLGSGLRRSKVRRIHNGLKIEEHAEIGRGRDDVRRELGAGEGVFLAGAVGRLVEEKGFKWFIKAAAELKEKCPPGKVRFVLVGEGPVRKDLERRVHESNLEDCFIFLGMRDDIPALIRAFDSMVVPSLFEPFGNVVLEAMLAGVPVIASRVGGIKEIINDGKDGLLIDPGDPAAIIRSIERVLADQTFCRTIKESGRQKVISYFNIKRTVDEIEEVYDHLLTDHAKGG